MCVWSAGLAAAIGSKGAAAQRESAGRDSVAPTERGGRQLFVGDPRGIGDRCRRARKLLSIRRIDHAVGGWRIGSNFREERAPKC